MYSRILCCAFCALFVSPALAIEVSEDLTIDYDILDEANTVNVRGNATLTIDSPVDGDRPILISHINLWDNSSLVFRNADLRGDIRILGDNKVDFLDGRFSNRHVLGSGNAIINIDGSTSLGSLFQFSGGSQEINVRSYAGANHEFWIRNSPGALVNVFSDNPNYLLRPATYSVLLGDIALVGGGNGYVGYSMNGGWAVYAKDARPDGDTNGDGVVDLEDLNNVRSLLGTSDPRGESLPLDGIVDLNDLNTVRNTFGESIATPVPEPATVVILCVLLPCLYLQRAKFRQRDKRSHA